MLPLDSVALVGPCSKYIHSVWFCSTFSCRSRACSVKCSLDSAREIVPSGMFVCGKEFGESAVEVCVCVSLCRKRRRKLNTNVDCACVRLRELRGWEGGGQECAPPLLTYTQHTARNFHYVVQES